VPVDCFTQVNRYDVINLSDSRVTSTVHVTVHVTGSHVVHFRNFEQSTNLSLECLKAFLGVPECQLTHTFINFDGIKAESFIHSTLSSIDVDATDPTKGPVYLKC
jgi:hypothetical protein